MGKLWVRDSIIGSRKMLCWPAMRSSWHRRRDYPSDASSTV